LRQVLVIPDVPLFETCVISPERPTPAAPIAPPTLPAPIALQPATEPAPVMINQPIEEQTTDYLGLLSKNEAIDNENESDVDESDRYITPQPQLKHFEFTEVEIDFKNIPDTIDVNEPTFDTLTVPLPPVEHPPPKTAITLKKHKDVLYEMYKVAKHKASEMKRAAMRAYLEAKEIKARYLLDDLDDYSSDDDHNK
jgi:hypothetical protein